MIASYPRKGASIPVETITAEEQRNLILSMFFGGNDGDDFLALIDHAGIDLAATAGETPA